MCSSFEPTNPPFPAWKQAEVFGGNGPFLFWFFPQSPENRPSVPLMAVVLAYDADDRLVAWACADVVVEWGHDKTVDMPLVALVP